VNRGRGVFLDRDGTILDLVPYLHDPDSVRLVPGAAEALRALGQAGWARVLVTNQSGIARGWFTAGDVERVHERMMALLRMEGADLEAIEYCPHHPDFTGTCACRKPASGMLERAAGALGIDCAGSWVIGDRIEDILAGRALGCRGILVMTGYGRDEARAVSPAGLCDLDYVAWDLPAAVAFLLGVDRPGRRIT
jgi:D-glycero-D-manno-heptose 1,7-bisphosphate phosphatase